VGAGADGCTGCPPPGGTVAAAAGAAEPPASGARLSLAPLPCRRCASGGSGLRPSLTVLLPQVALQVPVYALLGGVAGPAPGCFAGAGFPAAAPSSAGLCKGSHTLRSVLAATQAFSLSSCVANPAGLRSPAGGARRVSQGRGAAYVHARGLVSGSAGVRLQPFAGLLCRGRGPSNLPPQTFLSTTDAPRAGARPGRSVAVALTALDRATCFSARQTPSLPRQSNLGFRSRFRRSPPPSGRGLPRN
jgi:hypothetical protein